MFNTRSTLKSENAMITLYIQGGSNMIGTNCDLFTHNQSRSYLNHLVGVGLDSSIKSKLGCLPKTSCKVHFEWKLRFTAMKIRLFCSGLWHHVVGTLIPTSRNNLRAPSLWFLHWGTVSRHCSTCLCCLSQIHMELKQCDEMHIHRWAGSCRPAVKCRISN
jgi:hypothetical protein